MAFGASQPQYLGDNSLAYHMAASHPWARAQAEKEGKVFKNGVIFDSGVDEATAEDFFKRLGTHSPTGTPIPNSIRPGVNLAGLYRVTEGSGGRSDWTNYDPSDGTTRYTKIANVPGGMIWKREAAALPTPTPAANKPAEPLDDAPMREARDRVSRYKTENAGALRIPDLDNEIDPGYAANRFFEARSRLNEYKSAQEGAEIGYGTLSALRNFNGAVPNLPDPKELFKYYSDYIKNA